MQWLRIWGHFLTRFLAAYQSCKLDCQAVAPTISADAANTLLGSVNVPNRVRYTPSTRVLMECS